MPTVSHCLRLMLFLLVLVGVGCKPQDTPSQSTGGATNSQETSPASGPALEGTIVAMGNSLTAGYGLAEEQAYPAQLEAMLRSNGYNFRVINAGISGETSAAALTRTPWTLTLKPDIVILETGANDGLRGLPPDVTRNNIDAIVQQLQQHNVVVILAGMRMARNLGVRYTTAFANIYSTVARAHDLIFMPFFLDGVAAVPRLNQADGIHPTAQGYSHIVEPLYPYVTTAIKQVRQQRRGAR